MEESYAWIWLTNYQNRIKLVPFARGELKKARGLAKFLSSHNLDFIMEVYLSDQLYCRYYMGKEICSEPKMIKILKELRKEKGVRNFG